MEWLILVAFSVGGYLFFRMRRQKVDLSMLPEQFVVVDIETTGLSASRHEIIEIGAIKANRDSDNHITFQALVKPSKEIPRKITEITGITQNMVDKEGEDLESVMQEFIKFIGDLRLVAYNAEFDMGFLARSSKGCGLTIRNEYSCALQMARRAWPDLKSYKLAKLADQGGLSTKGTHRALKDCELALIVYTAAASKLKSPS